MHQYGKQNISIADAFSVLRALFSPWLTQGSEVPRFEAELAKITEAKYAAAVANGTAALHMAYLAAGLKEGDEVITTPNTFAATTNMIVAVGARPVFCDIKPDTWNIDEKKIEALITPKTKAIVPVHFAGHVCEMDAITAIAKKHNLLVIEDACHALGASRKGKPAESFGDMAVFSFHPVKSITTGEGGAVVTNNKKYYDKICRLRSHGITKDEKGVNVMTELGYNYRLTDIQAALGISQLKKLKRFMQKRNEAAAWYEEELRGERNVTLPSPIGNSSWHIYVIRVRDANVRDNLREYLRQKGVGVNFHYPAVYKHPYYKALGYQYVLPETEKYHDTAITLPCHTKLTRKDVRRIANAIKSFYSLPSYIDWFDNLARFKSANLRSGKFFSLHTNTYKNIFEDVRDKMQFFSHDTLLDMGGGTGELTEKICPLVKSVLISDGSVHALKAAREKLARYSNVEYERYDIQNDPYPFRNRQFKKILCYSVIHYLKNTDAAERLLHNLLSSLAPEGTLLVGDIPLAEKKKEYLAARKKNAVRNWYGTMKYKMQNEVTRMFYSTTGASAPSTGAVGGFSRSEIEAMMRRLENKHHIYWMFMEQNTALPLASSREDILIKKQQNKSII